MAEDTCISNYFTNTQPTLKIAIPKSKPNNVEDFSIDNICLSQITLEEPIGVIPFFNITPRTMPSSPHCIVEEELSTNPWAMLVTTIFLTKTSAKTARPYLKSFFQTYPTPYYVLEEKPCNLERFFINLGLKKRAHMIWKLSYQFVSAKWSRASDLCGIGKYGEDAYRMFCLGHTDVEPRDRYLRLYLDWLMAHTRCLEETGAVDCECIIEDPVVGYYRVSIKN